MEDLPCRLFVCGADEQTLQRRINQVLSEQRLQTIGRKVGIVQRMRKITPIAFLKALCLMSLQADFSLRMGAILLGLLCHRTVSKQAFWKKINLKSVEFMREILSVVITSVVLPSKPLQQGSRQPFKRVLIQDSSKISLPDKFARFYPGARNQTGRQHATLSLQTIYDALGEGFVSFELTPFTRNDQKAAYDIVTILEEGDLALRDLGYFTTESLQKIDVKGAYFISRYRHGTQLLDLNGQKINLLAQLRTHGALDIEVLLGQKTRLRARLVATPVPDSIANERRRKLRQNRDRRLNPSKEHLALLSWEIFVTNVGAQLLDSDAVCSFYGLRWRIEIVFKSWKSHFSFAETTDGSREYLDTLFYARLIYITLFQTTFFRELQNRVHAHAGKHMSLIKTAQLFAHLAWLLCLVPEGGQPLEALLNQFVAHCRYETRTDRLNYQELRATLLTS